MRYIRACQAATQREFDRRNGVAIFKVQIPIETNEPDPKALAYNVDKSREYFVPITDALLALYPKRGDWERRYKQFVYGRLDGTIFVIEGKAPWQVW